MTAERNIESIELREGADSSSWTITIRSFLLIAVQYAIVALILNLVPLESGVYPYSSPADFSGFVNFAMIVMVGPIIETIVFQFLFCELAIKAKLPPVCVIVVATVAFAIPQFYIGVASGIRAGLGLGFFLAYTYFRFRPLGIGRAVFLTIILHGLNNLTFFVAIKLSP